VVEVVGLLADVRALLMVLHQTVRDEDFYKA